MANDIRITIDQDTNPDMAKTVECEGFYLVAFREDDIGLHVMGRRSLSGWVSLFTGNSDGSTSEIRKGLQLADMLGAISGAENKAEQAGA
jgi:hypothetical protein